MLAKETLKFLYRKKIDPKNIGVFAHAWDMQKTELNGKVFLLFCVIATNVLTEDEFFGLDDKRIAAFREECLNLLDAVRAGTTKWAECCELFAELTGEKIDMDLLTQAGVSADECITKGASDDNTVHVADSVGSIDSGASR